MAVPELIDLKREKGNGSVRLLLMAGDRVIGTAYLRFWGEKSEVGILVSLTLSSEARQRKCDHFEEWMIEQVKREAISHHCSRLIVYKESPTAEEHKLYERLGFWKSIFGFCQSFSYLY